MKVLWFAVTPSLYDKNNISHNGGGWIASLEALVKKEPSIDLGIAFEHSDKCFKVIREEVTYYPINVYQTKINKFKHRFYFKSEEELIIPACLKVIADFKPDIIHVFGSEWCFGLVTQFTKIPVVIHMQGSIPAYYNARFPAGYSRSDFFFYNGLNIKRTLGQLKNDYLFKLRAKRELRILKSCKYYLGRTEWDRNIVEIIHPKSIYFYCSEVLRSVFYDSAFNWKYKNSEKIILATTISSPLYKGVDLILKTAKLLKDLNIIGNFEWYVFGIKNIRFHEWKTGIKASDVNIFFKGTVSSEELAQNLREANLYIHTSYIDNSPNSVCEAQILGLPVISTNVGGISSLINHSKDGLLFPANDPYTLTSIIKQLYLNPNFAIELGANARQNAMARHSKSEIVSDLFSAYYKILENEKNSENFD